MTCKCGSTDGKRIEKDGYVPYGLGVGGGDYLEFKFCAACGQIQDFEPMNEIEVGISIRG